MRRLIEKLQLFDNYNFHQLFHNYSQKTQIGITLAKHAKFFIQIFKYFKQCLYKKTVGISVLPRQQRQMLMHVALPA